jgi:hypothetical protein
MSASRMATSDLMTRPTGDARNIPTLDKGAVLLEAIIYFSAIPP